MPAPIEVDKEQVRMLVLSVGVREAARQIGLNEKTVLHWSHTGNWLAHTKPQPKPVLPLSMQSRSVVSVKPADALQNTLKNDHEETKINVLRYAKAASAEGARLAEEQPDKALDQAANMKQVAQAASIAVGEKAGDSTQVLVNIALLGRELPTE